MSLEQTIKTENTVVRYSLSLMDLIFETETRHKVINHIGDYLVYKQGDGQYAAADITDEILPESSYTRVMMTPYYKDADELQLYLCDLMIDKFVLLKRNFERRLGRQEYGKAYL
jgi:hypothetical protein